MRRLLDFDPYTRTSTYHDYDAATDKTIITESQDVQPYLDRAKRLANDPEYKRQGIRKDWYHFATVPNSVIVKLLKEYHLDINKKEDLPKIEQVLKRDFKKLLTVDKV